MKQARNREKEGKENKLIFSNTILPYRLSTDAQRTHNYSFYFSDDCYAFLGKAWE